LFCLAMWRPLIYLSKHVNSRCGHVSIGLFGHNVHCTFGGLLAKRCFYNVCPYIGRIKVFLVLFARMRCLGMSRTDLKGYGLFHRWITIYLRKRNWTWLLLVPFYGDLYYVSV
jgi:hypothetical protein